MTKHLRIKIHLFLTGFLLLAASCQRAQEPVTETTLSSIVSKVYHPEWSKNAVLYEVNVRQFTPEGTFKAFAEHLPRLKEMGVDILWFMPVTPIGVVNRKGTLGSYYSVMDYRGINPEFGTKEDFAELVKQIHDLGMYVIIDWVANHTAWDHPWTISNPEFYYKDENGSFTPPHDTDWSDVIQLEYANKDLWDAMIGELKYWVEELNIDGFRCDVAYMVPTEFWNQARKELDRIKPVFMLAEADHPELKEHAFNAGYSWTSHHAMNRIARGDDTPQSLYNYFFVENAGNYPAGAYKINFIDNHDENSWAGTVSDRLGDGMKTFAVLVHTFPGMPLIYNGQEAGLNKMLEFFEKDEIDWSNMMYKEFFTALNAFKKENVALWNGMAGGSMQNIYNDHPEKVFSFARRKNNNHVIVVANLTPESVTATLSAPNNRNQSFSTLFSDETVTIGRSNKTLELEPWEFRVFYRK